MPVIPLRLFLPMLLSSLSLTGCLTTEQLPAEPVVGTAVTHPSDQYIPVQRYGRYTLVELAPEAAQQNLLLQVIDIDLPSTWSVSVADAFRYALLRSGYQLCEPTPQNASLFALPLPAAHLRLGPMVLRDVLQTLAGPAWSLQIDEQHRQVCFTSSIDHSTTGPEANALLRSEASL